MATSSPEPNECSIGLLNINGLRNKTDEIRYLIEKHKLHVLALFETKIDASVKDSKVYIPGFRMWRKDRHGPKKGGGVALYVQDHIETTLRSDLMETEAEIIWVEMKLPGRSVLVGSCYRPLKDDLALIEIYHTMTLVSKEKNDKHIFLMGDITFYWKNEKGGNTPNGISVLGLTQVAKVKTRDNLKYSSCIDHVYTNIPELCSEPESTATGCSDHNLITFTVNSINIPQRIRRSNKEFNQNQFKEDMKAVQWRDVLTETNPKKALSKFTEKFLSIANKHAPLQTQDVYDSLRLNEELGTLISDRDKTKQTVIERRQPWEKIRLLALKKRVSTNHQKNQKAYFVQEFEKAENDSKALLKVFLEYFGESLPAHVINITKKGTATSEAGPLDFIRQPYSVLEFVAEAPQVQNKKKQKGSDSFSFREIDAETVKSLVMNLCDHVSHGIDETEAELLKLTADDISVPICHILNKHIGSKEFQFRENINGDSVHVLLGLIFDIILFKQAKTHISASHDENIEQTKANLIEAVQNEKRVQGVFLDFSFSFNTISHDLLMEKLTTSGFSDSARSLIKTFLSIRKGSRGLPRGSFLARLLFTVFINDLRKVLETSSSAVCDSCIMIYCAETDTEKLKTMLDNEVESVHKWAEGLGFTFTETRPEPHKFQKISEIYDILDSLSECHQDQLNWIKALEKIVQLSDVWYNHKVKDKIEEYFTQTRLNTVPPKVMESVINSLLLFRPELRDL